MRRATILMPLTLTAFVACSSFGSGNSPTTPDDPTPPAQDPSTNATPPVTGTPLVGIFVSTSKGDDTAGTGSELHPWKTLAVAIGDAKQKGQRVIACGETYAETVTLVDGVSLFGGYDCSADDWKTGTTRSQIRSATSPAVLAKGLALETRIDGFEIYAPDFAGDMPSQTARTSVALEVDGSMSLTFANSLVQSGSGGPGMDGTEGPVNTEMAISPNGVDSTPGGGGALCPFFPNCVGESEWPGHAGGTSKCALGASGGSGGKGGVGAFWKSGGSCNIIPQQDATGPAATATAAAGGNDWCIDATGGGNLLLWGRGTTPPGAADGADGANGAWTITAAGFVPGNGTVGSDGTAGIGGGGGGGTTSDGPLCNACRTTMQSYMWSAAGAGGGAGGCAGFAGTPGFGGGASIAAFVTNSGLTFSNVTLQGGAGGVGGKGTLGSDGLSGGAGGASTGGSAAAAGAGGGGGGAHGGYGGLSGHGAPGPSIALAFTGTRPDTSDNVALLPGEGGPMLPALMKAANQGTKMLPAVSGQSSNELMF